MAKIKLHGMFARVMGKFNKSESLYFKRCPCKKEQLGVDLLLCGTEEVPLSLRLHRCAEVRQPLRVILSINH